MFAAANDFRRPIAAQPFISPRYARPMRWGAWILALMLLVPLSRGQSILDLGSEHATRAVVTIGEQPPELAGKNGSLESEMTRRLKGVLADLQGKPLVDLRACVPPHPFLGEATGAERICVIHLSAAGGAKSKRIEVLHAPDGAYIAAEFDPVKGTPTRAELRRDKFAEFMLPWPPYRGGFTPDAIQEAKGEVFALPKPYTPARFVLDSKTMGDRFLNGGTTSVGPADRVLDQETLYCRLPSGYDPRHPAGLLVWIDPTNSGKPPSPFWPAADQTNLIIVGAAESGNNRLVSNREQLALDGVATVMRRYHVDPQRVYVTGMSGGGRVSSMMAVCFPEVFTGSVPIVGLACYERVPTGLGQWWPAGYLKPKPEMFRLFKTHRMAPMTGRRDFNQLEIEHASEIMQRDGAHVKAFEYTDMGHELPTAERFSEAIAWVDEPYQQKRASERDEAKKESEAYITRFGDKPPADDAARRILVKVTEAGPWTEEAWHAAELLGIAPK